MKVRLLLLPLLLALPLQAQLMPVTDELRVDTGDGRIPNFVDVSMAADGSYLVVWSYHQETLPLSCTPGEIDGRRFDREGRPLGAAFVATRLDGWCVDHLRIGPEVDGRRLLVWHQTNGTGARQWVVAALGASGRAKRLRVIEGFNTVAMVPLRSGGLLQAIWSLKGKKSELWGQRLGSTARPSGAAFPIARTPGGYVAVEAAETTGKDLAVSWMSSAAEPDRAVLQARALRADGTPRSGVLQVTGPEDQMFYRLAAGADGRFVLVWTAIDRIGIEIHSALRAAQYQAQGTPLTPPLELTPPGDRIRTLQDLALDASGFFVPVWQAASGSSWDDNGAELVDASGYVYSVEEPLAGDPTGMQILAAVATDNAGRWATAWTGDGPEGTGIYTRLFTSRP